MNNEQLKQWSADILYLQDINRKQQTEIEALKANFNKENSVKEVFNSEPVAWMTETDGVAYFSIMPCKRDAIPVYTHPHPDNLGFALSIIEQQKLEIERLKAKTHISNGHLSDCAIHNEPANRNKDCDCGFEPKFDLSGLKHEDNCRYFDDELYCNCGADNYALVEWYRHKEVAHPAKTLTDAEVETLLDVAILLLKKSNALTEESIERLKKASEK